MSFDSCRTLYTVSSSFPLCYHHRHRHHHHYRSLTHALTHCSLASTRVALAYSPFRHYRSLTHSLAHCDPAPLRVVPTQCGRQTCEVNNSKATQEAQADSSSEVGPQMTQTPANIKTRDVSPGVRDAWLGESSSYITCIHHHHFHHNHHPLSRTRAHTHAHTRTHTRTHTYIHTTDDPTHHHHQPTHSHTPRRLLIDGAAQQRD
jgi:hypothetical protein